MSENKERGNRLKILFLPACFWYPTEENPIRGNFVREHAQAVSLYNDVVVFYGENSQHPIKGLYEVSDKIEENIRTIRVYYRSLLIPKTSYFIYFWSLFTTLRKLLKEGYKPNIVHAHFFYAGVPAIILGKLYKIPVVITEHWSAFLRNQLTLLDRIIARYTMKRASYVLPVSENLRKHIERYRIKGRFRVIPNVVNTQLFYPLPNQSEPHTEKIILTVALLRPIKGIPYLLQALHQLRKKREDFILHIIGDGPNREEYESMTAELGLKDKVRFQGLKTKPEVAEFMRQCDFIVLPSLSETFGVVLIEALASGKPVVATNIGGTDEIVSEEVGILVSPTDINTLTKAIDHMLDHYRDYVPDKIAQYARTRFSYEAVGQRLDEIYKEIIMSVNQNLKKISD